MAGGTLAIKLSSFFFKKGIEKLPHPEKINKQDNNKQETPAFKSEGL
jgi:hypothetical protein